MKISRTVSTLVLGIGVLQLSLLTACDSGGSTQTSSSELTEEEQDVESDGVFLATCSENGVATIDSFIAELDLPVDALTPPTLGEVLAAGDPAAIPVLGGMVPNEVDPAELDPISAAEAEGLLPEEDLALDLPVLGKTYVSCDGTPEDFDTPEEFDALPDPTDAVALIPVFNDADEVVAVAMVVVGDASSNLPPEVSSIELPEGETLLPQELADVLATLLALLGL